MTKTSPKRAIDKQGADYRPTRGTIDDPLRSGASSILRAVDKEGAITLATLTTLMELAILPDKSALLKTIDNERDALETIRRLKAKT